MNGLFRIPKVRFAYTQARLLARRWKLRSLAGHGSKEATVAHNLKSLRTMNTRNEKLLQACLMIEDVEQGKVLIVGGRTEEEIFMFRGYGFRDVTAVDLISYSPLIVEGDMHNLPFADDTFDLVFCAYTMVYSEDPLKAALEFKRVLKPGGVVAIANEYMPWKEREETQMALLGYSLTSNTKLESVNDILALFEPKKVFVRYDAEKRRHHTKAGLVDKPSPVIAVFSV